MTPSEDNVELPDLHTTVLGDLAVYADDPTVPDDSRNLAVEWRRLLKRARERAEARLRVAFVAQVGRGKSTLLSAISGLSLDGTGNPVTWAVLPVGSGRTTLGDIRILPSTSDDSIEVTVDPLPVREILEETRLLAEDAWSVAHGVESGSSLSPAAGSELTQLLRSWLFPRTDTASPRKQLLDAASTAPTASEFGSLMQARLDLRELTSLSFSIPYSDAGLRQLKTTLAEVNAGDYQRGLAPRRVTIRTPSFPASEWVAELVDTQGIDSGATELLLSARHDLQSLRDDPDTLVVVCTEFEAAPDDVSRLAIGWLGDQDVANLADYRPTALVVVDRRDKDGLEEDVLKLVADEKMEECCERLEGDPRTKTFDRAEGFMVSCLDARASRTDARLFVTRFAELVHQIRENIWKGLIGRVTAGVPSLGLKEAGLRGKRARLDILVWRTWDTSVASRASKVGSSLGPLDLLSQVLTVSMQHWSHLNATVRRRGLYRKLDFSVLAASAAAFVATAGVRAAADAVGKLSLADYPALDDLQLREHLALRQTTFRSIVDSYRKSIYNEWRAVLVDYFLSEESDDLWRDSVARWGAGQGYVDDVKSYLVRASANSQLRISASRMPPRPEAELPRRPNLFWLDDVRVENFRGLSEGKLSLGGVTVIVGDNGEGKTAWLEAIASLLEQLLFSLVGTDHGRKQARLDVRRVDELRGGELASRSVLPLEVVGSGWIQGQKTEWGRKQKHREEPAISADRGGATLLATQLRQEALEQGMSNLPVFAYYGTGRLWMTSPDPDSTAKNDALLGYANCLAAGVSFDHVLSKLRQWTFAELQKDVAVPQLRAVLRAVIDCVDGVSDFFFDVQLDTPVLVFMDKKVKPLSVLSDGYRNVVAMVADLAWRAASLNPHLGEFAPALAEGLVMIDEVDLHLHPRWQRTVLSSLRDAFGRMQFVVTTHSPFVVQAAAGCTIHNLNPGLGAKPSENDSPEDIAEDILGVDMPQRSARKERMSQVAEEYYNLLDQAKEAKPEDLRRLRARLDELELPYASDVAFVTFLRRKRVEAEMK